MTRRPILAQALCMGWHSCNTFGGDIDDARVRDGADGIGLPAGVTLGVFVADDEGAPEVDGTIA